MIRLNIKKTVIAVLILVMVCMLTSCAKDAGSYISASQSSQSYASQQEISKSSVTEPEVTNDIPTDKQDSTSETSNILIAYFAVAESSEVDAVRIQAG